MTQFIPAAELKLQYAIYGHFYSVEISRGKVIQCRSVLEIVEHDSSANNPATLFRRKPDAVFIMMNPGSSQPLVEVDNRIVPDQVHELPISLVPTKPDTTQYQVMRLMHHCHWRHVRVLNLSDLRCTKSVQFFKQFKELEGEAAFDSHSIFSNSRHSELVSKITTDRDIPVVCAWGVSDQLDPLIDRCQARLAGNRVIKGLLKEGTTNKYLHPLPTLQKQKVAWFERMLAHCQQS